MDSDDSPMVMIRQHLQRGERVVLAGKLQPTHWSPFFRVALVVPLLSWLLVPLLEALFD